MYNQPYQTEISYSNGWKIFFTVGALLLSALFGWLIYAGFTEKAGIFGVLFGSAGILFFAYCLLLVFKEKLIVEPDRFIHVKVFSQKEVLFSDIEGYHVDNNYISIVSAQTQKPVIKLSTYIGKSKVLSLLRANFTDLDLRDQHQSEEDIIYNNDYGLTPEEAAQNLKNAKKLCNILSVASIILALWVGFYPDTNSLVVNMIFPVVILLVIKRSRGLIRVDSSKNSANPNLSLAFIAPLFALALRCFSDYHIFSFQNMWTFTIAAFVVLATITFIGSKEFNFSGYANIANTLMIAVYLFGYCVVDVLIINCTFDKSIPQTYKAEVLDKRISKGKQQAIILL
ncbi:hypothetical protein IM792_13790 [Mucilaginibacter sp. JRF]|uniref:hypothetical protein n=1 Tax=Mucilaginibacter sp. JRF TaxID=2780088 RepID=UPI00187E911B|nr:hypothetical protein [Mucilaginibacter sp. JRF]MBE9585522.1 hypothetical protein [Mucilaginibacter sp. JRF]